MARTQTRIAAPRRARPPATPAPSSYRAQMLADIQALAGDIGVRFMGTPGDEAAAAFIAGRFGEIGITPQVTEFPVMGWSLRDEARLEIIPPRASPWRVQSYPFVYSAGTPASGHRGRIVPAGRQDLMFAAKFRPFERPKFRFRKYGMVDGSQSPLAYIVSRDFPVGAKVAIWGVMPLPRTTPTVMIGEEDGRKLEELVAASGSVLGASLSFASDFHPEARTRNVLARLAGTDRRKAGEQILIMAHYDTQYQAPGAVDNASGVAALLSLADHFARNRLRRDLLFAVYSGEEVGFIGARHHLATLKEEGALSSIRAVLNLDMLACNEPNWIHASADFLAQESARRAAADLAIAEKYGGLEIVTPCWPSGDQDPFDDEGVPCVSFTWKGYKYPYTHTPEDTPDKVDADVLADSYLLARRVVETMDQML